ncbi:hypothetical protein B0H16DRAFT_1472021 [Mycena metata]|uniref:Uncharacterized protein n=1 Tax=Mycena metata TaxID=1033252 RepID=A0AAD7MPB3_9AGAR|nr:hypothetical protein B0H16DRAFT_1472021 [Mycena metata]
MFCRNRCKTFTDVEVDQRTCALWNLTLRVDVHGHDTTSLICPPTSMPEAVDAMSLWPSSNIVPPAPVASCPIFGERGNLYDVHITRRAQEPVDAVFITHLVDEHTSSFAVDRMFFPSMNTDIGIGARLVDPAAWNGVLVVTTVYREHNIILLGAAYLHHTVILTINVRDRTIFKHVDALNVKVNNEKVDSVTGRKAPSFAELVAHLIRRSDAQALDRDAIYDALLAMFPWILEHNSEGHWKVRDMFRSNQWLVLTGKTGDDRQNIVESTSLCKTWVLDFSGGQGKEPRKKKSSRVCTHNWEWVGYHREYVGHNVVVGV